MPKDIISQALEKGIEILPNRDTRRECKKLKDENRIKFILDYMESRVAFIIKLNELANQSIDLTQDMSYNEILERFNADNCINYTLFILNKTCDDDFDAAHFDEFMESEQFTKTIDNTWLQDGAVEKTLKDKTETIITENPSHNITQKIVPTNNELTKNNNEELNMETYLGYIKLRSNTHYYFYPKYKLNNGYIEDFDNDFFSYNFKPRLYLKYNERYAPDAGRDFLEKLKDGLYSVSFIAQETYIAPDNREIDTLTLNLTELCKDGVRLHDRIKTLNEVGIFKIVTPLYDNISNEELDKLIKIDAIYPEGEPVYLKIEDCLYGPCSIRRPLNGDRYVKLEKSNNFLFEYSSYSHSQHVIFKENETDYDSIEVVKINSEKMYKDIITKEIISEKVFKEIDHKIINADSKMFEEACRTLSIIKDVPEYIAELRLRMISEIINDETFKARQTDAIIEFINNSTADEIVDLLNKKFKDSSVYKEKIEEIDDLKNENADLIKSKNQLQEEFEIKKQENEKLNKLLENEKTDSVASFDVQEREELNQQIISLKNELTNLSDSKEKEANEYEELKKQKENTENQLNDMRKNIESEIKNSVKNATRHAFDPYISNQLITAASEWNSSFENNVFDSIVDKVDNFALEIDNYYKGKGELKEYLIEGIQKFRNYPKNAILNMLICISQNFLTIFSGEPGTGKTSICNIIGHSLGLHKFEEIKIDGVSANRYQPISVERGWSSKRDLIGYYNPLTRKYDSSNKKLYDGLMILNKEGENSKFPYLVLLDEANLSPMEYYWADFMRISDRSSGNDTINIGLDEEIYIPETLRFVATINNDQTTERLSPRLIDRSWIVKLPDDVEINSEESLEKLKTHFETPILWESIKRVFIESESAIIPSQLQAKLEKVYNAFKSCRINISPRVKNSIEKYLLIAQNIMFAEGGVSKEDWALDYAVVQKLLPKIDGQISNYSKLFEVLKSMDLEMTNSAIAGMEKYAEDNMGYCTYLI